LMEMFPFFLYFVTALVTGFHVYTLMALTVYGAPFNPLELVSFLGSLALLIAAYVSLFKPQAAAKTALLACLGIWSFYGPAIAKTARTRLHKQVSCLVSGPSALPPSSRFFGPR
jgi:hypothetical protein